MTAAATLGPGAYFLGCAAAALALFALGAGAWRLRAALMPQFVGADARLVESVLALGALILVAQLLGSVHAFSRGPVFAGVVGAGIVMLLVGSRLPGGRPAPSERTPLREPRAEVGIAAVAVVPVGAQWLAHAMQSLTIGMTQPDTLWYHGPFAARFIQERSFTGLGNLGYESSRFFPLNSELVHALVTLPFQRDLLSPLVNIGWAALALLAAWCIGHRRGVGALAVIGVAVVLALPVMGGVEPGQASNDTACAALLLTAVAVLLIGEVAPAPTAIAGLAAGLAVGTKLTAVPVVATITIGLIVIAVSRRRPAIALAWCGGLLLGGYWFVRNWVGRDNPLPWFGVHLGPISFRKSIDESGTSLVDLATEPHQWSHVYHSGLHQAFGVLWPLVIALALGSIVVLLARGPSGLERLLGCAVLVGAIVFFYTPLTGGPGFVFNLRYLAPTLVIGFAMLPAAIAGIPARGRLAIAAAGAALLLLNVVVTPGDQLPAWPKHYIVEGVVAAVVIFALALLAARPARLHPLLVAAAAGVAIAVVGWPVQHRYLERRYVAAGLSEDVAYKYFRGVHDARVAVFGTQTYPIFGVDLSNRVDQVIAPAQTDRVELCRKTRALLGDRYDYVVLTPIIGLAKLVTYRLPDQLFTTDAAATEVAHVGETAVYRLDGALDPNGCT